MPSRARSGRRGLDIPTAAELTIVIEAQDRASAQLRTLGQDVQRLERQVESARRSGGRGGGLLGALTGGVGIGAGIGAVTQALGGVQSLFGAIGESIFGMNSRLERATAQFTVFTGSAAAAQRIIQELRREADVTPFNTEEVVAAGAALSTVARAANVELLELVRTAEALAASQPSQGLEGAAFALREAVLGGDFQSIIDRFNLSRVTLNRLREEGVPALAAVQAAMREVGATREQIEAFGRTFEGRQSTITSFFDEIRRRLGEGIFQRVSDLFGHMVNLIAAHGERLLTLATDIGQALGAILERVAAAAQGPLRALVDAFAPGLWASIETELSRAVAPVEAIAQAAQQAAPAARNLNRELAEVGVQAATVQLEAQRVERAYDAQLEPLQRQLRLLQQSADVQRVQNALATNRATVEGLRLEREVAALRRAAGGATDPNAPGLTLRQRLIALALQERELRQEELGLEGQRRPLIQSLEQQIASLQEQQRQALAPLQAQLETHRANADAIQLEIKQTELLRLANEANTEAARRTGTGAAAPEALEDTRKRGEAIADRWLTSYREWIERNGGSLWTALGNTLEAWYETTGKPLFQRVGGDLGTALGDAAGSAAATAFKEAVRRALFEGPSGAEQVAAGVAEDIASGRLAPGSLPTVTVPVSPPGRPGAGAQITINVGELATGPGFQQRLQAAFAQFWQQFIQSEAAADPGASARVQGAGRAP
jgi:hypothetical protein